MRIVDAKVIVCSPGRELAVAAYLTDHVIPLLVGRDARQIEDTWHYLYKGGYWRRGPVTSHLRKIAALAELYQVAAAPHFDLSVHNFGIQEYMRHTDETDRVFPYHYSFQNGFMRPGDAPGLGVDIDESSAAKYPYDRAYLPVNRRIDGTVHSW